MNVKIQFEEPSAGVTITPPNMTTTLGMPVAREYLDSEPYYGEYEVTPDGGTQTLATTGKRLARDVVVNPAPVTSVNGEVGDVVLDASDVGALPDDTAIPTKVSDLTNDSAFVDAAGAAAAAPVQSVNSKTGAVSIGKSDVGLGSVDNVQQYSATNPPPYPVSSVNGKTGAVTLTASDVSALPDSTVIPTVPTNVSDFVNDAGYITSESDPVFSSSAAAGIDAEDITAWNNKSDFSGSYNDLTDKPTIPGDTKVEQMAKDPASWTYWRPLLVGYSSGSSEGFTPSDSTNGVYAFKSITAQPSTGTIRAGAVDFFKGSYEAKIEADTLTADRTAKLPDKSGTVAMTTDIPSASSAAPQALGTAAAGSSGDYSRADHVHDMPDASDVGALPDTTLYAGSHTAGGAAELTVAIPIGEVDSTSTNTTYTATVPGIHDLKNGVVCYIRNDVVTSTTNCTLNVNGLGAKPIYVSNADATRVTSAWSSATTWLFIYNEKRVSGGCWDAYYGMVNSNTIGYQVRTNSSTMALSDKCYRYRLLFTSADGTEFVPANADTQTSAAKTHTTNTTPIDPFGTIYYYGSTTAKAAGDKPSATVLWQQYVITLGYSFNSTNAALSLTASHPVYITATPQADGSAVLDYFTQALPSTNDGKIYIFLGIAIDATTVEIQVNHPVYYHNGTGIRRWTGGA